MLHELGHHLLHGVVDHFAQCDGGARVVRGRSWWARQEVEREASHFSTEILMPELWAALLCQAARPALADVARHPPHFRVSLRAARHPLRRALEGPLRARALYDRWPREALATETAPFPGTIVETDDLHPACVAASLQNARAGASGEPREVPPGAAWGDATGAPFIEHAIALGPDIPGVLSWLVPAA